MAAGTAQPAQPFAAEFLNLLESVPDAIVILDGAGRIVLANGATEELFGFSRDELAGRSTEMLVAGGVRAASSASARRKDGTQLPVDIHLSRLETAHGSYLTATLRDVTERDRASQAKESFLGNMSHELRTPLNAIIGFTGTMLMGLGGSLTDEQREQLEIVQANGKRLLSLINDVLDLTKIESGRLELAFEPVDCRELVDEVALGMRGLAQEKGFALGVVAPPRGPTVYTDRRAVSQILTNLTGNAIKFTGEGDVTIELVAPQNGSGSGAIFRVADTGPGIAPEQADRLFEAFERGDASTSRSHEGTGLGLYLSQRLASLIGGRITFETEVGTGTTFALELPRSARTPS